MGDSTTLDRRRGHETHRKTVDTLETVITRAVGDAGGGPVLLLGAVPGAGAQASANCETGDVDEVLQGSVADCGKRYALAIVVGVLEHLPREQGVRLIGTLRDLRARRLLVAVPAVAPVGWRLEDMLAHGLEARGEAEGPDGPVALYGFDIDHYKRTPDWLNPHHWANPEMWGRHRW